MRILQIITRMDSIGGAQRHVVEVCQAARDAGHEVHLAYGGVCALKDEEVEGIRLHCIASLRREISPAKDFTALKELYRLMKNVSPDLVATHSTKAGILGRFAALRAKVCNIHTVHGWSVSFSGNRIKRFAYREIERRVHRMADGIICVCEYDYRHALEMGFDESRLVVIYNGRPDPGVRKEKEPCDGVPVRIVSVGRMAWPKQPEQLLRFLVKCDGVRVDFLGSGPREDEVKKIAKDLGVDSRVVFHGHVEEVFPVLSHGDIFALVSDWEGFPMSTLEAMAVGMPTVVSHVGGAPEAVVEGVTGYTIPRGDESALNSRLMELVSDADLRLRFGKEARAEYERRFRLEKMAAETLRFYAVCVLVIE